jgi:hypothetical protein
MYGKDWEDSLPYAEFSYNNSYQASLKMSSYEALYGRKCRTPLMWSEVGDCIIEKPDFIAAAEDKVAEIRENLKAAQSRQKSYADKRRHAISFDIGDHVYLKVSPIRGTRRFQVRGKLAPRFIGPLSSRKLELLHTRFACRMRCQVYMMSSLCPNCGSACEYRKSKWFKIPSTCKKTYGTKKYP